MGVKGGVGSTTIAVNLATALAMEGERRTVLMDGYFQFGGVQTALNIHSSRSMTDLLSYVSYLESEVVGRLCNRLWKDRIDPITLMAAADERIFNYRHPIPSERDIDRYLMVSVNARKWGLIVSLTRFLYFGTLPEELRKKYEANVFIDCTFMAATRPGVPAREVLQRGIDAYREKGFLEEWELHHQGGSIGYTGRDYRTNFNTPDIIQENQAFTWNPSITGSKSEDTILATSGGPVLLTRPVIYPEMKMEVEGYTFQRPGILEK